MFKEKSYPSYDYLLNDNFLIFQLLRLFLTIAFRLRENFFRKCEKYRHKYYEDFLNDV